MRAFSAGSTQPAKPAAGPVAMPALVSQAPTITARQSGKPWVNISDGLEVVSEYQGSSAARAAFEQNAAKPLALASGDFNGDGVADIVGGYVVGTGLLALWPGNIDAHYPNSPEAQQRRKEGKFTEAPFLTPALTFEAPIKPEFLVAGYFNADGFLDLAMASADSNQLVVLPGTGDGRFGAALLRSLPGKVTALVGGDMNRPDGLTDLAIAVNGTGGAGLLVFESAQGAIAGTPESFPLPADARSLALGHLDTDAFGDLAVVAGSELLVIHGRDRKISLSPQEQLTVRPAIVERRTFDVALTAVAVGDFTGTSQDDLALLTRDAVQVLYSSNADALSNWRVKNLNTAPLAGATHMSGARLASLVYTSLVITTPEGITIVTDGEANGRYESRQANVPAVASAAFDVQNGAAAIFAVHLNSDNLSDLVVLRNNRSAPSVALTAAALTFTVTTNAPDGAGSLKEAITNANANPGADVINFMIGSGPQTITPTGDLPPILDPVTIDGSTQPGFAGAPLIEINGAQTGSGRAFKVSGGNTIIRSLVINNCFQGAIQFTLNGNNKVEGCYLGTDLAGNVAVPNNDGVEVFGIPNTTIGGTTVAARNVLSGNIRSGVNISGNGTINNFVIGNYIGTNAAGAAAVPNQHGVYLNSKNNTIGGTTATARNVISGNTISGVRILSDATIVGNLVQGNYIGTDVAGSAAIANAKGVFISNSPTQTIGGTVVGAGNLIAGNSGDGITIADSDAAGILVQGNIIGNAALANAGNGVTIHLAPNNTVGGAVVNSPNTISFNNKGVVVTGATATGNWIRANSIFSNAGLGIDLADDGVTPNDAGDTDSGPNGLQNYPVISVLTAGATTTIEGTLNSTPGRTFLIEFFFNAACDPSNNGEGQAYVGFTLVTTDAGGNASFTTTLPVALTSGQAITATATDFTDNVPHNTSEFSICAVICGFTISPTNQSFPGPGGTGSVDVTTFVTCDWTAVSNVPWVTITSGATGVGSGTVNYTVAPNGTGAPRSGTLTIAEQTFTVNQGAGYTVSGHVQTAAAAPIPGVTMTFTVVSGTGAIPPPVQTDANGNWAQSGFEPGTTYRVTPTKGRFTFTPTSLDFSAPSTSLNFTGARNVDTVGVFRPSTGAVFLKNSNSSGFADIMLTYGIPGDLPVAGDWNGDGVDTIGVFRNGTFFLRNFNTNGFADVVVNFGAAGDLPVVGDWDGDGVDTIGVYRNGTFLLRNSNTPGAADLTFDLGVAGDVPISGDWNGDGIVTTGVFRPSTGAFFLKNSNSSGFADIVLTYGVPGDKPVTGDWDGDGVDTIGVFRNGTFLLRNSNTNGFADIVFDLGIAEDRPIAGDWNGLP